MKHLSSKGNNLFCGRFAIPERLNGNTIAVYADIELSDDQILEDPNYCQECKQFILDMRELFCDPEGYEVNHEI